MKKIFLLTTFLVICSVLIMVAQPANDDCSTAQSLGSLPTPGACNGSIQNGAPTSVSGSVTTATPGNPYVYQTGCAGGGTMTTFAHDVWYSFTATGTTVNINITSGTVSRPNIALYSGSCGNLGGIGCNIGTTGGTASLTVTQIQQGQTYYIQVSGNSTTGGGTFNLSVDNDFDCNDCLTSSVLTASPLPVNGAYQPGQVVHFCYKITGYTHQNTNWLHGVQVSFGSGWSGMSNTSAAADCGGSGTWAYYTGGTTSSANGNSWPAGFYFDYDGFPTGPGDGNPGNNLGDNCAATGANLWTFCWDMTVNAGCAPGSNLSLTVNTSGDGESGSWTSLGCTDDDPLLFNAIGSCCPPTMASTPACSGGNNGTATATPVGAGTFTYSWSPGGQTTQTATGLATGTYTVTVTNTATNCAATNTVTVTASIAPVSNAGADISLCSGIAGSIGAAAVAGNTYLWSPTTGLSSSTSANPTITLTNGGATTITATYTITTTNTATTCTSTDVVTITVKPKPVVTVPANISQCAGLSVAASSFTSIPTGATYAWTNSNTATGLASISGTGNVPSFTGTNTTSSPITSTITVTPTLNGCTGLPVSYTITINPQPTSTFTQSVNQCLTGNSFTFASSPVLPVGYTQTWNFGGGGASPATSTISPVTVTYTTAGTYTITHIVTATGGCTSTTTSTVTIFAAPTAIASTIVNTTCGASNGSVALGAVTGGTPTYTYSFNGSGFSSTTSYTALAAGTYPVIVKDFNGCTYTTSVTVLNIPGPTALAVTSINSTCGNSNGIINIGAVTGGTAPYTYSVNGSPFTATTSYTGFAAGTYTVVVKDFNGCTFTRTIVVSNTPGPTALAVTSVNSTCGNANGVINIGAVTGGTAPYTYSVNGSAFTSATSYTGFAVGTYNVIVQDFNGCTFTRTIVVSNTPGPTALVVTNTNASCGASNGTINIGAVTGGTSTYTYSVNGSGFTATTAYTGFAAGTYTVIVKDFNGCTFTTTTTIVNSSGPTALVVTSTNSTCGNSNGTATIGATTGGAGPYTYSFNGSAFTATTGYTLLAAGTYSVVVKDNNGCSFTTSVTVVNTPGPTAIASTPVNSTCGASNGSVSLGAVTGGTPVYTYSFNGSGFTATTSYTALLAGTYPIIVKDFNGCTFSTTVTIGNTPGSSALAVTSVNSTCGAANGVINIGAVTGGTAPYTYSVNASAFTATTSYTGFAAGTYTVIVKDFNGCTFTTTVTVVNTPGPTALATTTVNSTCGNANGTVNIGAVTGGVANYVYNINGGAFTTTTSYTGLAAATYTVVVKDNNGCIFTTTATVINTPGPTALAVATVNSTCGNSNGIINIGAVTGGTSAYTYSVAGSAFTTTVSYPGFAAGTYTVVVKDFNGCTFTTSATIINSPGPTAIAATTGNASCGLSNGTITLGAVTGGVPTYTYSVDGSAFAGTTAYTGFAAGTYSVVVKDFNGCTFTTSAVVNNSTGPTALVVSSGNSTCGSSNGTVTIGAVTGGLAPYTYSFNGSAFTTTTSYTAVAAGTYNVVVKDNNGCTFPTTITVINNPGPTALAVTTVNSTCGASNGVINIGAVTGGSPTYTYSVNASAYTATVSYTGFAAGTYTVIVKDLNGCTFSTTATVINTPGPTAIASTLTNTTCGNPNGSVVLGAVTGGTGPYTYSFNASAFTATTTYSSLAAGSYSIIVKDFNGCTFTTSVTLTNTPGPTAIATTFTNPTCGNANGTITIGAITGGTPTYTYSFNGGGFTATSSYTGLAAGSYPIIVEDFNGCQFTVSRTITNVPGPTALATTTTNASCGASNGSVTIGVVTGGTSPFTYSFNGGAFGATTNFTGLAANSYPVIVQDFNGCQFSTSATVNNSSGPTALVVTNTDATCGNSNGTATIGATTGGAIPLSYSFNGGAFTTTTGYTGLAAGTYAVIVKDNNGCTFTTSVTISNIAGPTALAITSTNTTCGAANGTITIGAVTGGTATYTYSINASAFSATTNYTALLAGTYTLVVKDFNGCTFTTTTTLIDIPAPTAIASTLTNTTCGTSNGSVVLGAVTGGTAPYTYSFNASAFTATTSYSSLAAGSYSIIVKDFNGCTYNTSVILTNTPGPTALATTITNSTCGNSNGSISIGAVTGGTAPYSYSFSGGGFTTTTSYTGLAAGTYPIIVKDFNGCTFTVNPIVANTPGPTALATSTVSSTCGGANGSITIGVATGGTAPYTYSVNGSAFTATTLYNGLAANSYPVIVQDFNGCQFTTSAIITDLSGLTASETHINVSCNGGNNGSITTTAGGSTSPYSYSIDGGITFQASGTFSGLSQGNYTIIAKDGNGCTVSVPVTITQPPILTGTLVSQTNINCFGGTGSVTVSASGGTTTYSYAIDAGGYGASATFNGLAVGAHTITIKDFNNCTTTVDVTITQPAVLALITSSTNAICTAANGSATVTASGGTTNYTYLWTPGSAATATAANITAGNYSVLVTDAHGCTQTASVSVGANTGASATISSSTNVTCIGAVNGTATVSMGAGSIPPFTYAWSPSPGGGQGTATATGLSPSSYNITVTDGYGCVGTTSVTITEPTQLAFSFITTPVSCNGGANGTATINPSGGTPGYTYLWSPGGYTTQTITNLAAGTYTCVFTDYNGCSKTATTAITQPLGMSLSETHVDANCSQSNGSATVSVTGGTGPYSYLWNDPGAQTTLTATGLASNTYAVTVTDANICSQVLPVTINDLSGPVASIFASNNVSCFGNNDGSATAVVTGGNNPYQFSWSNGQTIPTATNLMAGTYTLTATDMSGCITTVPVAISEPTILNTTYTFTDPTCFGLANGTITTASTGGTAPYTYLWTPGGATTSSVTGLLAGTYFVTVTDAHSCTSTTTIVLTNPAQVTATTTTTNVTCNGLCNGTATANPLVGNNPFTYVWNDANGQTTALASGLCAGSYTVTVTDNNGCSTTSFANITSPNSMAINITALGNVSCFGACDGFAQAAVTGGSAPYSYLWMPGNTAGGSVNNLCAATYTVTATDANGCYVSTTATITQPFALTASIVSTDITCYQSCDGGATAVYQGGTGPYTFQWTPSLLVTPTIANICAGVQNLAVSDSHGCTAIASVVMVEPTILAVSTTTTNSNCGSADGSACAQITGGSPPFIYVWNDPMTQTASCANNINAGVYTISVTDSHGCSVTNVANVNDNAAPIVTIPTSADVTCHGAANGNAQAAITGGILPYSINWNPGVQNTAFINSLSGGIYSIIVTDSVGCIGTNSVTINEPATLVSGIIASTNVSCALSCDGSATVAAGGGTAPYTYLWNDAATQTSTTATGLCAQQYNVAVTDTNGCTSSSIATIGQPTPINIQLVSTTNVTCNSGNNGQITTSVSGGTPGYTYSWTPNVGSSAQVTNLIAGSYQLLVTDANGCTQSITANIQQPGAILITTNIVSSTCSLPNGGASVSVSGGITPYTYFWSPTGTPSPVINMVAAGTYSVTVTDNNGCTADTSVTIQNIAGPTISNITYTEPTCNGTPLGTATVAATGGQPLYTYLWSGVGAQTTQTATALPIGTYQVTVSDANHCNVIGVVTITEPSPLVVVPSPNDTICIGQLAQIYGAGYGGTQPFTYTYSPAMTPPGPPYTVNPLTTTFYNVYVTDANNCVSAPKTISVYVRDSVRATASDTAVCNGSSVPIFASATGGTGGPYTYSWSNGINTQSQNVSPLVNQSPSNYTVMVSDGCSPVATAVSTVTVYPLAVSFMFVIDTAGCEDFTVQFTAASDIGTSYTWDFGDGSASQSGMIVTHTYVNPNSYNVSLTVTTGQGCVSTITNNQYIDVYPAPIAEFTPNPNQATTTAPLIAFIDQSIGANTWAWDFGVPYFGSDTSTTQNPIYTYADTGSYNVQLIVTNNYGCTDTISHPISIIPEYVLYAPNAFTPFNHDGLNDTFMPQGVGIDPNNFEMWIFDRWGNLIYKTNDINKGWDGKANGGSKIAQADTYVWKIVTKDYKGDNHQYIGRVSLVR